MYKMSWPDLACASAARVSSALLAVKRSIWTSTFSFAAHSWINASDVLLASGTKWSQKPIESLPAACAVLTNGAAIIVVVDAAADAAMNRRRVNIFPFMVFAPFCARAAIPDSSRNRILQRRSEPRERLGHALKRARCAAFVALSLVYGVRRRLDCLRRSTTIGPPARERAGQKSPRGFDWHKP